MSIVDIVIVLLVVLSAIQGYRSGLVLSVCSLFGLVAGIAIASWNYKRFSLRLLDWVHSVALAEAIWFCLIALAVMLAAGLAGMLIRGVVHGVGLGWLDRLIGLFFGLLRGAVLVTLGIVTLAAFFPETTWLEQARTARYFLRVAQLTTLMTPEDLKMRMLQGLHVLEKDAPEWLHQK